MPLKVELEILKWSSNAQVYYHTDNLQNYLPFLSPTKSASPTSSSGSPANTCKLFPANDLKFGNRFLGINQSLLSEVELPHSLVVERGDLIVIHRLGKTNHIILYKAKDAVNC